MLMGLLWLCIICFCPPLPPPCSSPLTFRMLNLYRKLGKAIDQLDYFTQNEWKVGHCAVAMRGGEKGRENGTVVTFTNHTLDLSWPPSSLLYSGPTPTTTSSSLSCTSKTKRNLDLISVILTGTSISKTTAWAQNSTSSMRTSPTSLLPEDRSRGGLQLEHQLPAHGDR